MFLTLVGDLFVDGSKQIREKKKQVAPSQKRHWKTLRNSGKGKNLSCSNGGSFFGFA